MTRRGIPIPKSAAKVTDWTQYQSRPIAFGRNALHHEYTSSIRAVMQSVCDNRITVARSANKVGKTFAAAACAVWFWRVHENAQVWTTTIPFNRLKLQLWSEVSAITLNRPNLFADAKVLAMHIERVDNPRSFITAVPISTSGTAEQREAKFSGASAPHLLFIVDEGDAVPEAVYRGIESCMSGQHVRLLIMFNPKARLGPVWRKERDGEANVVELSAFDHPNVVQDKEIVPGAVSRETVVRRINQWTRALAEDERPDAECFHVPSFLVGAVAQKSGDTDYPPLPAGFRKVVEPAFSYMVLGQYPAQGENQLISQATIDAARTRWDVYVATYGEKPPEGVQPVLGLDVAEFGADSNVAYLRYGGWVARAETWSGVDPHATGKRGHALSVEHDARANLVDATGVGAGVAPHMTELGAAATSVKVAERPTRSTELGDFTQLRDQLAWAVREWLRTDAGSMLPPDELLLEELSAFTYSTAGGKIKVTKKEVLRETLRRSPDRFDALALTFASEVAGSVGVLGHWQQEAKRF